MQEFIVPVQLHDNEFYVQSIDVKVAAETSEEALDRVRQFIIQRTQLNIYDPDPDTVDLSFSGF